MRSHMAKGENARSRVIKYTFESQNARPGRIFGGGRGGRGGVWRSVADPDPDILDGYGSRLDLTTGAKF